MRIISHRGNLNGRIPSRENSPSYIDEAISHGYEVEVDVWYLDGRFYLGHDEPQYEISEEWLSSRPSLWCHAKNFDALNQMMTRSIHCFWHETDRITITSKGLIWCYPNTYNRNGITVDLNPEATKIPTDCMGVCTDIPEEWKLLQTNSQ